MGYIFLVGIILIIVGAFIYDAQKNKEAQKSAKGYLEMEKYKDAKQFKGITGTFLLISERGDLLFYESPSNQREFNIKDINSFKVLVNGNAAAGGIGSAVAGGLIFGGAGVITGAILGHKEKIKSMAISFYVNDFNNPEVVFKLLDVDTSAGSYLHQNAVSIAESVLATLAYLEKTFKGM